VLLVPLEKQAALNAYGYSKARAGWCGLCIRQKGAGISILAHPNVKPRSFHAFGAKPTITLQFVRPT
jgi:hypothetical protein